MNIYDYDTFKINSLSQAKLLIKKNINSKINFLHPYDSIVWQGPLYLKTIYNKIISKKVNYIIETKDDVGLFLSLINLEFKFFAYSSRATSVYADKLFSIAKKKDVEMLIIEKLKIQNESETSSNL